MITYLQELRSREKALKTRIKDMEEVVYKMKVSHPEWMDKYDKLQAIRNDLAVVISRIENYNKQDNGCEEYYLPNGIKI